MSKNSVLWFVDKNMLDKFTTKYHPMKHKLVTSSLLQEMTSAKKLPCGHIFHLECLRSWLLRQQTCPTCRIDILQQQQPTHQPHPPPGDVPPPGYYFSFQELPTTDLPFRNH